MTTATGLRVSATGVTHLTKRPEAGYMVPGQFGAGQFSATIRLGQFGAKYDINFIENSAFIQQYSFHQSRFYISNILFFNPSCTSAIFF